MNIMNRASSTNFSNADDQTLIEILRNGQRDEKSQRIGTSVRDKLHNHKNVQFEPQLSQMKSQLGQAGTSFPERDVKCQKQAAIIEALVQQMSDMEDQLNASYNQAFDSICEKLVEARKENEELRGMVGSLEFQLTEAKHEVKALNAQLQERNTQINTIIHKEQEQIYIESVPSNASSIHNKGCKEEQCPAVIPREDDYRKEIRSLQCSLTVEKQRADVLENQLLMLKQEQKLTDAALDSRLSENAWVATLHQRLVCAEEERNEVERKSYSDKAVLEYQVSEAINVITFLKTRLEDAERKAGSHGHTITGFETESVKKCRRTRGSPAA